MNLNSLIIPFVSGIAGFGGGVVATYIKWDIEKRKMKVEARKQRIQEWRSSIEQVNNVDKLWGTSVIYDIQPYLTREELKTLHTTIANIGSGGTGDDIKKGVLFNVVSRIEKTWELI